MVIKGNKDISTLLLLEKNKTLNLRQTKGKKKQVHL